MSILKHQTHDIIESPKKEGVKMIQKKYLELEEELQMIVPIVARVHGDAHPEFHDVKRIYDEIHDNIDNASYDFASSFKSLRDITNNYEIPNDVCQTYEKVYTSLKTLDEAQ